MNKYICMFTLLFGLLLANNIQAQSLWGSGAYQGQMICPYELKTSRAAVDGNDEVNEERKKISKLRSDAKRKQIEIRQGEGKLKKLREKLENYFEDSVLEFLLDTHIEGLMLCTDYRTAHPECYPKKTAKSVSSDDSTTTAELSEEQKAICDKITLEPPPLLEKKWNTMPGGQAGYCTGGKTTPGSVSASICNDMELRPVTGTKRKSTNKSECVKSLAQYRKEKIELGKDSAKNDDIESEIEEREDLIPEIREKARLERELRETEGDCEDCDEGYSYYKKPKRDWWSTATNVLGGLGMMYIGKRAEQASGAYHAQAGMQSIHSYGHPFYQAGMAGVINGIAGPGAYGCASTIGGGGFPYGAGGGWGLGGSANGAFGPFAAAGGAFGYPQNMYGSPWGGGAFNPGFGPYGNMNGPNLNAGIGFGGGFGSPFGGGAQVGNPFGSPFGGGAQIGNPFGSPFGAGAQIGSPFGIGNPMLGGQYQLQMMQQQAQMQQQQMQMQMQYYQAQMQQQQQMVQQQYMRQQQSAQIQMQIAQLTMQLQAIQQQSYYGGAGSLGIGGGIGGGIGIGGGFGGGFGAGFGGGFGGGAGFGLGVGLGVGAGVGVGVGVGGPGVLPVPGAINPVINGQPTRGHR